MVDKILIGLLIIFLVYLIFFKKNENMVNDFNLSKIESQCNLIGENLIIEKCLINSKGKYMDNFLECLKLHNISQKVIDNFSPLYYAILADKMDCSQLVDTINNSKK
jgi:hypothetical protein